MAQANRIHSTPAPAEHNRRTAVFVMAGALASAACAIGLAAAATRPSVCPIDPIHDAIAGHREAARAYDAEFDALWPLAQPSLEPRPGALREVGEIEVAAIERVINTAPTTPQGLVALSDYLKEVRSGCIAGIIAYRLQEEGHTFECGPNRGFDAAVAFFIARRKAELEV